MSRSLMMLGVAVLCVGMMTGCGDAGSKMFSVDEKEVQTVKDVDKLSELEEIHFPVITSEDFGREGIPLVVVVTVGPKLHPAESGHYVEWIDLLANGDRVAAMVLSPEVSRPELTANVMLPAGEVTLTARAKCNEHGVWQSTRKVQITKAGRQDEF
jgi:superoxide reductase